MVSDHEINLIIKIYIHDHHMFSFSGYYSLCWNMFQMSPNRSDSSGERPQDSPDYCSDTKGAHLRNHTVTIKNTTRKLNMDDPELPNIAHAHTGFVQYVHLEEGQKDDYYSSPVLGTTLITRRTAVIETRL